MHSCLLDDEDQKRRYSRIICVAFVWHDVFSFEVRPYDCQSVAQARD